MKSVKIGVIGCGSIANAYHLPALARVREAQLVWACDLIEDRAAGAMRDYGFQRYTLDYRDILEDETIEAVCILTKIEMHAKLAIEFAGAGKSILMQKPFAYSIEEGRRIIRAVEENRVRLVPSFMHSYMDGTLLAKALIDEGRIGRIEHIRVRNATKNPKSTVFSYGGCMMDIGCHGMNLVHTLTGDPVKSVYAARLGYEGRAEPSGFGDMANLNGSENAALLMYGLDSGVTVEHEIFWSQIARTQRFEAEIYGEKGVIYLYNPHEQPMVVCGYNESGRPYETVKWMQPKIEETFFGELQHRRFVLDVLQGTYLSKNHREGFVPLQVVEAARRSAVSGKREHVLGI